jgi:CRP-like cAMP-binding protein
VFELLYTKINSLTPLSDEEFNKLKAFFLPKKLRKRQFLVQAEEECKYLAFVEKGILRSYTIDSKGNEHVVQFAFDGWWISDMYGFFTGEPATYSIDVLDNAELLILTKANMETMFVEVPKLERFFRILIQNSYIALQRRMAGTLTLSAEERYLNLLNSSPNIATKIPQHMVASYLGVTPETLSRIRKHVLIK